MVLSIPAEPIALAAALAGRGFQAPDAPARLAIALDHFRDSLTFYGDRLGLKIFRKHLGWYVENAPWPTSPEARREAKSRLCRMTDPREVEAALTALWQQGGEHALAA